MSQFYDNFTVSRMIIIHYTFKKGLDSHFCDEILRFHPGVLDYSKFFNCSQTKFAAIRLDLTAFYAIFCLTDFLSDPFDFSSSKTG